MPLLLKEVGHISQLGQRETKEGGEKKKKQGSKFEIEYEENDMERAKKAHQRKRTLFSKVMFYFLLLCFFYIFFNFKKII
jgi:hypothetical protein